MSKLRKLFMRRNRTKPDEVIVAEIYNDAQVAVFWTDEKLGRYCDERGWKRKPRAHNASAAVFRDEKGVDWYIAFIPLACPAVTVCHECLHLAWYILSTHGVKVTRKNHEALAYLQQHLARQVMMAGKRRTINAY